MSKVARPILKDYFETGKKPTHLQFADLIDSAIIQASDGVTLYNGNVGIGHATPAAKLTVKAAATDYTEFRIENDGAAKGARLLFTSAGNGKASLWSSNTGSTLNAWAGGGMTFHTGVGASSAQRMAIGTTGRVGIGATTLTDLLTLTNTDSNNAYVSTNSTSGAGSSGLLMRNNGTTRASVRMSNSGNILELWGTSGIKLKIGSSDPATTAVSVNSSGYVGFGVASPEARVHIQQDTDADINEGENGVLLLSRPGTPIRMAIDNNEIQVKSGTSASTLFINHDAANVQMGGDLIVIGDVTEGSDRSLKKNIKGLARSLDKVMQLSPVSYELKKGESGTSLGLVAQDVEAIFPEMVRDIETKLTTYKGLAYRQLIPVLIKAVQEQQEMIDDLKIEIQALKGSTPSAPKKGGKADSNIPSAEAAVDGGGKAAGATGGIPKANSATPAPAPSPKRGGKPTPASASMPQAAGGAKSTPAGATTPKAGAKPTPAAAATPKSGAKPTPAATKPKAAASTPKAGAKPKPAAAKPKPAASKAANPKSGNKRKPRK